MEEQTEVVEDEQENREEFGDFIKKFILFFGVTATIVYVIVIIVLLFWLKKSALLAGIGMIAAPLTYILGVVFVIVMVRRK